MRYRRLRILVFATLLATAFTLHCLPTEAQSQDRRRSTTFLAASSQDSWPEWDGVTAHPELTDAHPTTGWPTEIGRICVTFTSGASGEYRSIIDGRQDGDDPRPYLSVVDDGRIRFGIQTVGSIAGGEIIPFHTHTACVDRSYGPTTSLYLDGLLIGTSTSLPAWDWHPTARLGSRYGGADPLGGEINSIQWRGLRLACDMQSDTCSDGRQIATTRPTPVPCEVSPGVWEMVPEDTGCYGVRGLEAWAATTSYLSFGAELDRSPWVTLGGATVTLDGSTYRVCAETGGAFLQQLRPEDGGVVRTAACLVRADTSSSIRLLSADVSSGGRNFDYEITDEWQAVTATATVVEGGGIAGVRLHPTRSGSGCVEVAGCWSVIGDTPGRACWGGEAPVHCAEDRHTISTEGWPTESGEISVTFSPGPSDTHQYIIDGRAPGDTTGKTLLLVERQQKRLRLDIVPGQSTTGPILEVGRWYVTKILVRDGRTRVLLDGVEVINVAGTPQFALTATLGNRFELDESINGSISSLTVRSYEEVSP